MSNKSRLLFILIYCLFAAALIVRKGELLLLATPLLVYLIIGALEAPGKISLQPSRQLEKLDSVPNGEVIVRLVVENQGDPIASLSILDDIQPSIEVIQGHSQVECALGSGAQKELKYKIRSGKSLISWHSATFVAGDSLGLFTKKIELTVPGEIFIRPQPLSIKRGLFRPRSTLQIPGLHPARKAGAGIDFWAVRDYETGDSLRRINWKLSGKYPGRLFTNEFEKEEIADIGFIVDARKLTRDADNALFQTSAQAAASLAESFIEAGNRVAMLIVGRPISSIFPGCGKRHLVNLQRTLAATEPGGNIKLSSLENFSIRLFPPRSMIVIFSPAFHRDLHTYSRLLAHGYQVVLISPDPIESSASRHVGFSLSDYAIRAAKAERAIQFRQLMKLGVTVIDWPVHRPLSAVLLENSARLLRDRQYRKS